jgi:hypothetical protein
MYMGGAGAEGSSAALRSRPVPQSAFPSAITAPVGAPAAGAIGSVLAPADEQGPASAPAKPKDEAAVKKEEEAATPNGAESAKEANGDVKGKEPTDGDAGKDAPAAAGGKDGKDGGQGDTQAGAKAPEANHDPDEAPATKK